MSWKRLTVLDLQKILSKDEYDRLKELSVDTDFENVVQDGMDLIADQFRGAFIAKGYDVDVREHYLPPEYHYAALVLSRFAVWTRFPSTPDYALDEARKKAYEDASALLKNPYIGTSKPDYSDDPEIKPDNGNNDGSIAMPILKFPSEDGYIVGQNKWIYPVGQFI